MPSWKAISKRARPSAEHVGAYEIEGLGIQLFASVSGDISTIIGLTMLPLLSGTAGARSDLGDEQGLHHRLAGCPFALPADSRLLAAQVRASRAAMTDNRFAPARSASSLPACRLWVLWAAMLPCPHKQAAFAAAARKHPGARAVGAANTLWYEDGALACDNTDGAGFIEPSCYVCVPHFKARAARSPHSRRRRGLGDRARLSQRGRAGGAPVQSHARAPMRSLPFGPRVKAYDWTRAMDRSTDAGILVNATTLGMAGGGGRLEIDLALLDASCVVADLVYVPLVTPLLAAAKARGLTTVDGLGMLLHQAVPGFEKWFGVQPAGNERTSGPAGRRP